MIQLSLILFKRINRLMNLWKKQLKRLLLKQQNLKKHKMKKKKLKNVQLLIQHIFRTFLCLNLKLKKIITQNHMPKLFKMRIYFPTWIELLHNKNGRKINLKDFKLLISRYLSTSFLFRFSIFLIFWGQSKDFSYY